MEPLTPAGQSDHGPPDPLPLAVMPVRSVLQDRIERDLALLATMSFRCADHECGRYGPALAGNWTLVPVGESILTYCSQCAATGGGS
jgi:hypothetical protein